jgi:hypothetical protein
MMLRGDRYVIIPLSFGDHPSLGASGAHRGVYDDLFRADGSRVTNRVNCCFLVTAGSVVVWIPLDVRGFRLVLARGWHGVQSAAWTGLRFRTYV